MMHLANIFLKNNFSTSFKKFHQLSLLVAALCKLS